MVAGDRNDLFTDAVVRFLATLPRAERRYPCDVDSSERSCWWWCWPSVS